MKKINPFLRILCVQILKKKKNGDWKDIYFWIVYDSE